MYGTHILFHYDFVLKKKKEIYDISFYINMVRKIFSYMSSSSGVL